MLSKIQTITDLSSISTLGLRRQRRGSKFSPGQINLSPQPISAHSQSDGLGVPSNPKPSRRDLLVFPSIAIAATLLLSTAASADENTPEAVKEEEEEKEKEKEKEKVKAEDASGSRIYDATAIGEPLAVGKGKGKVWEKLLGARVVYLGEAETVPDRDDRVLELDIVTNLRNKCFEQKRSISLALEVFPLDLQNQLNLFMSKKIDGEGLRSWVAHWPPPLWKDYEPLLNYCRDNGVRLVACGTPIEIVRTVQAEGIHGLSKAQRGLYAPPIGSDFISGISPLYVRSGMGMVSPFQSIPFAPSSYLSAQSRVVDDYTMSQSILQAMKDGGSSGMLLVVAGASHVIYGTRGVGIPARISKKWHKKSQAVILLDPERQQIRREGDVPVADFLWYSSAKTCSRNCFDRAEISRVMNAAGQRREALPQDLQRGLDLGLVSPENLQVFFDLEKYPIIAKLIDRFQGFRERLLADPKFLHRLATEEAISITTTLLAQYERRKERFFDEIDYVITDTIRGSVVDFFTVWLPAPTLSFLSSDDLPENLGLLKGLLGSIPDNAFQKITAGKEWDLNQRFVSVLVGGLKLAGVGFVSSIGAWSVSNGIYAVRRVLNHTMPINKRKSGTPLLKSAVVYGSYLGTSANLRYQVIAGLVEHRISDYLLAYYNQPMLVNALSFVVRTINSYWGTQQWVDLARFTGLQPQKTLPASEQISSNLDTTAVTAIPSQGNSSEEVGQQSGDNPSS